MPMATALLVILLLATVLLLAKSYYEAQQRQQAGSVGPARPASPGRYRPRPRRQSKSLDERQLAEHVKALREAVAGGLISREEAAASIVRQTDGQLSEEAALQLLRSRTG
jgi:hypothetical protein